MPDDLTRGRRTAVVFLNNGSASQLGPGRAWVEWGRRLAADGAIVLRADLSGLGDSAAVDGAPVHDSYPLAAGRNIAAMVTRVRELGAERVVLVGLCSGALLALDGLLATPDVDVVVSINGRFDKAWTHSRADRHLRAAGRTSRVFALPLGKTPLFPVFQKVPHPVWRALAGLHLVAAPTRAFRSVRHHRARLLLVFGAHELGIAALEARDVTGWRATKASDQVTVTVVEGLDHSMFEVSGRDRVYDVVHGYLRDDQRLL